MDLDVNRETVVRREAPDEMNGGARCYNKSDSEIG